MEHQSRIRSQSRLSNRDVNAAKSELIDLLVAQAGDNADFFGPEGVFTKLKGAVMERLLQAELAEHLESTGREPGAPKNARNGYSEKSVQTESGTVRLRIPRDREGSFEPKLVKKHQRRLEGFDEKVLALYARGMTMRDIQAHLRELYGTEVSHELISRATEAVMPEFRAWQSLPLDTVYPVVYLDALFVTARDGVHVKKRAFYIALGVRTTGEREVLGIWAAESEGAKYWLGIMTELRDRGVQDILFVCADGLSGLDRALEASFPQTVFQTCVVHLIRTALRFVSWADRKLLYPMLRKVYTATTETDALEALSSLEEKYGMKYPGIGRAFRNQWQKFVPFLSFPEEVRRIIYTTNAIESLNSQLRKALGNRGPFPNDEAVFKLFYLALSNATHRWKPSPNWPRALLQLNLLFEDRLPV